MMALEIVNPLQIPNWEDLILATGKASFFHSSAWARVLHESYGYEPLYFASFENGKLSCLMPFMEVNSWLTGKRGVSLPFTDYCEPIVENDLSWKEPLDHIIRSGREKGWKYFELRGSGCLLPETQVSSRYLLHTLDLTKEAGEIFRTFRKGTKSAIKKAEKADVELTISTSEESIIGFYELNCITRKSHGLPPQPRAFFRAVYRHILKSGLGIVILASHRGERIAGGVFFHSGKKAIYKYGAAKRKYQDLRATNLIVWRAINYYMERGCNRFCFGRTERENEGLLRFKRGWGAEESELNYYRYCMKEKNFRKGRGDSTGLMNRVFTKMPVCVLRLLGDLMYRHVG
jgi:hypothetical protein